MCLLQKNNIRNTNSDKEPEHVSSKPHHLFQIKAHVRRIVRIAVAIHRRRGKVEAMICCIPFGLPLRTCGASSLSIILYLITYITSLLLLNISRSILLCIFCRRTSYWAGDCSATQKQLPNKHALPVGKRGMLLMFTRYRTDASL